MASSSTVGTAVVKLSFDGSDVKGQVAKTTSDFKEAGEKAGSGFGNAITVAMGSLISKGISKVISTINSNLSSAINRVDVMNNFPKVMKSLGFSADEADASIKMMSARIDGLPTTLNGLVGDVQKLTATMGNLNTGMVNATSVGIALNDMFLAGGKGTEAASAAMEQYNQMLAQGKPDMQSWRSMLNAAPGQLKQLAKTLLGATANQNDLYNALQKGKVTFAQMNEAIVKLDREGGDGFDSFERQARAATGGVGTALQNVQSRISKAIATVIDTIGGENIAAAINEFSSHFKDIGVEVGKFVKYAMQQIGEFTRFISNNMWIVDIVKGAIASIIAIGIGKKIIDLKNKVQLLFAAISAHPLLALATALIGVATAIGSAITREDELQKSIRNTREQYKSARESLDQLNDTRQQALNKGLSELNYYAQLKDELQKITDENGKVKQGYENRAEFIVNTLKNALGVEISLNDGVVESYNEISKAIDETIKKKKAELLLQSQEAIYAESLQKRAEVSKRLVEISHQLAEAENEPLLKRRALIEELTKSKEEEEALYREYSTNIQRYESDLAAFTEEAYDKMSTASWNNALELANAENASVKTIHAAMEQIDVELDMAERAFNETGLEIYRVTKDNLTKTRGELVTKLEGMNMSVATSMSGAKSTVVKTLNGAYAESQRIAAGFGSVGSQMGTSLSNGVWAKSGSINNAVNGTLNEAKNSSWGTAWNDGWSLGVRTGSAVVNGVASQQQPMISVGQMLSFGLRDGMNANAWNVVTSVASNLMNDFKSWFGIHSPSTVFRDQIGVMLAKGLGIGFEDEMQSVTADMAGAVPSALVGPSINYAYANNWSGMVENAIMEQSGSASSANSTINVYMNNTIDNDMSIDELGRKFSQSIRRYA